MAKHMTKKGAELPSKTTYFKRSKLPAGLIHWSEAKKHIGEQVRLYGEVVDSYFNWEEYERWVSFPEIAPPPTFLEIGLPYPDKRRLRVVIWGRDRGKFKHPPNEMFDDTVVVFTGKPYLYKDMVHVQVSSPDDITVSEPIDGLYVDYFDSGFDEFSPDNVIVIEPTADELEEHRRRYSDWEDPELYGSGETTRNEWGEEVEVWSIPGTNSTMYFDEDNGWMVD